MFSAARGTGAGRRQHAARRRQCLSFATIVDVAPKTSRPAMSRVARAVVEGFVASLLPQAPSDRFGLMMAGEVLTDVPVVVA